MATTNGSTAIRDKILASLARYRALRIGKFPCAFWRLSARPGLTAGESLCGRGDLRVESQKWVAQISLSGDKRNSETSRNTCVTKSY
ncbi:hypothetical protein [Bathymodiolus japonicus methanotrophic gill symbiont]|uniref:hypothetical protein n=1 Tax=Bathymodiolus japonicus methanotrophic gill symbiont TaxID=113269 RepID=UPI001C8F0BD1|nr:hypothetical protein [Bathymodiolus japonicus methanotrophic gill symbiont]